MSDLTPAQRIEAAIVRLEELKRISTPGNWQILDNGDRFIAWHDNQQSTGFDYILSEPVDFERSADADLIITLHSTIDAQIGILSEALYQLTEGTNGTGMLGKEHNLIVRLADAILSGGTE